MAIVRAVAFDLGGVLVQISHHWSEALRHAGLSVPPGRNLGRLLDFPLLAPYQAGKATLEEYLAALGDYLGGTTKEDALRAHNHILRDPYPGTEELTDRLRAARVRKGCLSNTNAAHWDEMLTTDRFPAVRGLDFHVASHIVGSNKPASPIYAAFEQAAAVTGPEIAYFDDAPENVAAALDRGWRATLIDPHADPAAQMTAILRALGVPV